jgi:hypothetical protein
MAENDTPNFVLALDLLRPAPDLASVLNNPLRIWQNDRKKLQELRQLFESSLFHAVSVLQTISERYKNSLPLKDGQIFVLEGAFKQAWSQYKTLATEIVNIMPSLSSSDDAARAIADISVPLPHSRAEIEEFLGKFKIRHTLHVGFYARIVRAGVLLEQSAALCVIDLQQKQSTLVKRAIIFPPEYKQSAIVILSYFNDILNTKYPLMNVTVTIEQQGDKVTLIVETPAGERETIERELRDYGMVVTGELPPEQYLQNPQQVIALKHKLEIAALELRHTKELLQSERSHYGERILSLEDQTKLLREMLDKDKDSTDQISSQLRELVSHTKSTAQASLKIIIALLERGLEKEDTAELEKHLREIKRDDSSVFERMQDLLIKGAIQGAAGNYFHAILQAISRMT